MNAPSLLEEIRNRYFTDLDNLKENLNISFQEIAQYEYQLLQIVIEEGNNALTETLESYIEELKKGTIKTAPQSFKMCNSGNHYITTNIGKC